MYGADFMLSDNLQPWLLEVNSSPTMACSTQATDQLVNNLMDDIVKGILEMIGNLISIPI